MQLPLQNVPFVVEQSTKEQVFVTIQLELVANAIFAKSTPYQKSQHKERDNRATAFFQKIFQVSFA
jgi:hypothetical protein